MKINFGPSPPERPPLREPGIDFGPFPPQRPPSARQPGIDFGPFPPQRPHQYEGGVYHERAYRGTAF